MSFHPKKPDLFLYYEVVDAEGNTLHETESAGEIVELYRQSPVGSRLLVSGWVDEELEAHLVGQPIDVTPLVGAVRGGWVW